MALGPSRTETTLLVSSPAFDHGQQIPRRHTCDGDDLSPPIHIAEAPDDTRSYAILMEDPDSPGGTFVHWLAWNLQGDTSEIPEGADIPRMGGREGNNGFRDTGYSGPCPPPGGAHRYFLRVFALSDPLELTRGVGRSQLEAAMRGKVLAEGTIMGTYQRSP